MNRLQIVHILICLYVQYSDVVSTVDQLSAWFDRQYHLLTQIYRYIGIIELCLLRMSFKTAASVDALGLKQCIIILLAGQITLSAPLLGWHGESARKSYLAALQIVDISSTFVSDEFYLLYSIVVVCLSLFTLSTRDNRQT